MSKFLPATEPKVEKVTTPRSQPDEKVLQPFRQTIQL
jgi:hypothetical protein